MENVMQSNLMEPQAPLVSVIVTAFQHERFITQCIESIVAQQCTFPFEIILGEDDSTDGTRAVCLNLARQYPGHVRLFLRDKANRMKINGKSSGRYNATQCMMAARGTYLAFCDGDDYWTDVNKLQNQIDLILKHDAAYSFHDVRIFDDEKQLFKPKLFLEENKMDHVKTTPVTMMEVYTRWPIQTSSFICIKPPVLPDFIFKIMHGDMGLFALGLQAGKGVFYNQVASVYRRHNSSFMKTTSFTVTERLHAMLLIDGYFGNPNAELMADYFKGAMANHVFMKKADFNRSYYRVPFRHIFRLFWLNVRFRVAKVLGGLFGNRVAGFQKIRKAFTW